MQTVKLDLNQGIVFLDSIPITTDEKGILAEAIAKLCSPPTQPGKALTQYRLSKKTNLFGQSCECIFEINNSKISSVTFLFDLIEFFESSILESKILRACEKSSGMKFISDHPSKAFFNSQEWGSAIFSYDPKQGDLSLNIIFRRISDGSKPESTCVDI